MTLPSSGPLSFSQIEAEFGSNGNRGMGRYRADSIHFTNKTIGDLGRITEGGYLPLDTGIPKTGTIKFSDFRGKSLNVVVDCVNGGTEDHINAKTKYTTNNVMVVGGFRGRKESGSKIIVHVNKTFKSVSSNSANTCALRTGNWSGIVGMTARSIPVREEFWSEGNIDVVVLCNSLKNVASHPKVITYGYSNTRSNLEFPLTWHNFSIGSGNVDARLKHCDLFPFTHGEIHIF